MRIEYLAAPALREVKQTNKLTGTLNTARTWLIPCLLHQPDRAAIKSQLRISAPLHCEFRLISARARARETYGPPQICGYNKKKARVRNLPLEEHGDQPEKVTSWTSRALRIWHPISTQAPPSSPACPAPLPSVVALRAARTARELEPQSRASEGTSIVTYSPSSKSRPLDWKPLCPPGRIYMRNKFDSTKFNTFQRSKTTWLCFRG